MGIFDTKNVDKGGGGKDNGGRHVAGGDGKARVEGSRQGARERRRPKRTRTRGEE